MGIETGTVWKCDCCSNKEIIAKNAKVPYPVGWVSMEHFVSELNTLPTTFCSRKCLFEFSEKLFKNNA